MTTIILAFFLGIAFGAITLYIYLQSKFHTLLAERLEAEANLKAQQELHQQETKTRNQHYEEQLTIARREWQILSQQLTEENRKHLRDENLSSIGQITQPLEKSINEMRLHLEESRRDAERQQGALSEQVKQLLETNQQVGEKAEHLTQALRGDNKFQGNWGEMILENLLIAEGLHNGEDYELQCRLKDNLGVDMTHVNTHQALQPDAVLHYPNQQDVIIDAKTSLKAFIDYKNAVSKEEREKALKDHIKSVRQHIKELAKKDYSSYVIPPRQAIDFVVMFVPNESALQLALKNDNQLWSDAFDHRILLAGELNLRVILRIIRIIWRQHKQVENQHRVFELAETLLLRAGEFVERYENIGKNISTLQRSYNKGRQKLHGKQSIIGLSNRLKDCGVKDNDNHKIPEDINPILLTEKEE